MRTKKHRYTTPISFRPTEYVEHCLLQCGFFDKNGHVRPEIDLTGAINTILARFFTENRLDGKRMPTHEEIMASWRKLQIMKRKDELLDHENRVGMEIALLVNPKGIHRALNDEEILERAKELLDDQERAKQALTVPESP